MRVTFWGTRGSVPVPGSATLRYGGNTSCVSLEEGSSLLVLDAGTGIRCLGQALAQRGRGGPIEILLSHAHTDHISGLPFFPPIHDPLAPVRIFGPRPDVGTLREVLTRQMTPPLWPASYAEVAARLDVTEITAGRVPSEYFQAEAVPLRHPGRTLGYSISAAAGAPMVNYMTDNELGDWTRTPDWQVPLAAFLRHGGVLIHDATYDDTEIPKRSGWGHSSASQAVDLAMAAGMRRLILFHHAPEHGDDEVDRLLGGARRRVAEAGGGLLVEAAAEGSSFDV
jgi:phosphoribosyl 1,2-cyclic phosphodiesterase